MKKIKVLAIAGVFTASLAAAAFAEMADVKVSGEIRVRDSITNNTVDFDNDLGDSNNIISERTRVNVDAKVNETVKVYISLQDTRTWGSERNTADTGVNLTTTTTTTTNTNTTSDCSDPENIANDVTCTNTSTSTSTSSSTTSGESVDISQAYIQLDQLAGQPLSLKIGRQALAYGNQRLIGAFEWGDNARRFDAIKLAYNTDAFGVDLFTAKLDENGAGTDDGTFNGLYATVKTIPMNALDLYILQKSNNTAGESMLTYGLRIAGGTMNIDWDAEYAMQGGDKNAAQSQDANMFVLKAGYTLPEVSSLRIGAEYDFASGQESGSSDSTAFDQLYPTNHDKYGVSDIYNTLSNLSAWSVSIGAKPAEGVKLVAEYWDLSTDEEYAPGEDHLGSEFNIQAWYALSTNVDLHAYWARFMPEGSGDDADSVVAQLAVKF